MSTETRSYWSVRVSDFKLSTPRLSDVSKQQDGVPFFIFSFYRFVVAGYFFGFLLFFMATSFMGTFGAKFFIFLTDWTYMLVNLYLCVAFANALIDYISGDTTASPEAEARTFRYQFQWLLFNMSITVSIIVTITYWSALRPFIPADEKPPLYLDISVHLLPTVFLIVDLFLTKIPVRFVHVIYPALYLIVYLLFALIYWAAGGTDPFGNPYIYPIIDFQNKPGIAVATVFGVTFATFLSQAFVKLLHFLRCRFIDRNRTSSVAMDTIDEERQPLRSEQNQSSNSHSTGEII